MTVLKEALRLVNWWILIPSFLVGFGFEGGPWLLPLAFFVLLFELIRGMRLIRAVSPFASVADIRDEKRTCFG